MKLISMVLYGTNPRYWSCLLPSLITHWELYPGFAIRLYITPEVKTAPGWQTLSHLSKISDRLQLIELSKPYIGHSPMMWRLRPLWDSEVDLFFTRDIDSIPSRLELASVQAFQRTGPFEYSIHSIRSHPQHSVILMGGLSGFRYRAISHFQDKNPTFLDYFSKHPVEYDNFCDQRAMEKAFKNYTHWIFDTPITGAPMFSYSQKDPWIKPPFVTASEKMMEFIEEHFEFGTDEHPNYFLGMPRHNMNEEGKRLIEEVDCDSTRMVREVLKNKSLTFQS